MSQRFGASSLHQRDPRSALFENYSGGSAGSREATPPRGGGYGYQNGNLSAPGSSYRPATPNSRGQYSNAVLDELESQNDNQVEGIMGKVKMLKSMTVAIGDEIRDSSALAEKMNDSFDNTRVRLRSTVNRMMIMAEKTGIGWKVWLAFFAAVGFLFFYVWVF